MIREEWLAGLKVGDEVAVRHRGAWEEYRLATVTSAPRTMVVVGSTKFRRSDGSCTTRVFGSIATIEPLTPEVRDEVESERLRYAISAASQHPSFKTLQLSTLRQIAALLGVKP